MNDFKRQSSTQERKPNTPEKKELSPHEKLKKIMARISQDINLEAREKYGLTKLVGDSLHINALRFSQSNGGIYPDENVLADQKTVDDLDRDHSAANDPNTQAFYKDTYGIDTVEGIVAKHREKKETSKSNQAEMAITALMHKVLKERFLVVRTSLFDDYKNGIDNLILDKETGAIICAFDEVLENDGDRNRGASQKIEKIKKSAVLGGTRAKYGVSLIDKKIVRSVAHNIPVFYLTLESKDLTDLTNDLYYGSNNTTTDIENRLFAHLVTSISEQKKMLEGMTLPSVMKEKLREFESSLTVLRSFATQK